MQISITTYHHHEAGIRPIGLDAASRYAAFFGVSPMHILFGEPSALPPGSRLPIVGLIGTRGVIQAVQHNESVPAPAGQHMEHLAGLKVVVTDLWPFYRSGDVAFYDPVDLRNPINPKLVDCECVVINALGLLSVAIVRSIAIEGSQFRATVMLLQQGAEEEHVRVVGLAPVQWIQRKQAG